MQKHVCLFSRFFWMKLESCAAVWTAVVFLFSPCCVWWRGMRGSSPLLQYCSSRLVLSYRLPHEATRSDILSSFCYLFCFSNSHSSALSSFHLSPSLLHAVTPFCLIIQTHTYTLLPASALRLFPLQPYCHRQVQPVGQTALPLPAFKVIFNNAS